ncbi:MAG: hypothetical protein RLZZ568_1544 [Cyanobacteriota bacterium]
MTTIIYDFYCNKVPALTDFFAPSHDCLRGSWVRITLKPGSLTDLIHCRHSAMPYPPADQSLHSSCSDLDCLQATVVPARGSPPILVDSSPAPGTSSELSVTPTTIPGLATRESVLQATDSFEFNYIDRPAPQPSALSASSTPPDILSHLLTPWSFGGVCLLVVANGLLTLQGLSRYWAPPPVVVSESGLLPPVQLVTPPRPTGIESSLTIKPLSHLTVPPVSPSPAGAVSRPTPSLAPLPPSANPAPQPPFPPPSYPTTATVEVPPLPPSPGMTPTITLHPIAPLPPPANITNVATLNAPLPLTPAAVPVQASPVAGDLTNKVEEQLRRQLPPQPMTDSQSAIKTDHLPSPSTRANTYNQSLGSSPAEVFAPQQLVQELESLNQAP